MVERLAPVCHPDRGNLVASWRGVASPSPADRDRKERAPPERGATPFRGRKEQEAHSERFCSMEPTYQSVWADLSAVVALIAVLGIVFAVAFNGL